MTSELGVQQTDPVALAVMAAELIDEGYLSEAQWLGTAGDVGDLGLARRIGLITLARRKRLDKRQNLVADVEQGVRAMIALLGDDPDREGLQDTPRRVRRWLEEVAAEGQAEVTNPLFADTYDEMLLVRNIPLTSLCEHHLLPYNGVAHIGYIPNGHIVGLSKLARVVKKLQARLTVQERLTREIAQAIQELAGSPNVAVITTAAHSCMVMRGVKAHDTETTASAMLGAFREDPAARSEFLTLVYANAAGRRQ